MVGVSHTPGGMIDANHLLLLKVGVGLLTAGGGPSGGVSCCGASDVVVAGRLTRSSGLLSLSCSSLSKERESSFPSSLFIFNAFGASLMYMDSFTFLSSPVDLLPCPVSKHHPALSRGRFARHVQPPQISQKAASLQATLYSFILVVRLLAVSPT